MHIGPEEIEGCLVASDMVANAVAFGLPRNEVETAIIAAVVPRDASNFTEAGLMEYGKREMPKYMRPDVVWRFKQFPQTSSGKPDRVRLKEMYQEQTKH
jgi:acyl-coenzyme A synthetase/AMP-(fatty) acid ligase